MKSRSDIMSLNKTFDFLEKIKRNNNREWFNQQKDEYQAAKAEVTDFTNRLFEEMNRHDSLDQSKIKVYRIFRDVRFSKNKTPFKTNWSGGYQRLGANRRGGYFFAIEPGNTRIAGGFFGPNPQDLLHIRKQISQDPEELQRILSDKDIVKAFGTLEGEQVKTAPKGFDKEDPAIELLRYKQLVLSRQFKDEEVMSADFPEKMSQSFAKMRPFVDYMTEILTTDLNGVSTLH